MSAALTRAPRHRTPRRKRFARRDSAPRNSHIGPGGSTAAGGVAPYRLTKAANHVAISGRWLDCGSCAGEYTGELLNHGADTATGIEIDPLRALKAARRTTGPVFVAGASEALPFPTASFDGVLLNEVLEHVADERGTLAQLLRVLKPGGVLLLFSPNRWFPFEGHGMTLGRLHTGKPVPVLPWLPAGVSNRVAQARNYWPGELRELVASVGFEVQVLDFALPLLSHYPWLPRRAADAYRRFVPRIERSAILARFGVSTFIVASKPTLAGARSDETAE